MKLDRRKAIIDTALYAKTKLATPEEEGEEWGDRLDYILRKMSPSNMSFCIGSINCALCRALFPRVTKQRAGDGDLCPCDLYSHNYLVKTLQFAKRVLIEEGI